MNLGQSGWRWCRKCEGVFFAANPTKGRCPADRLEHDDSESGAYLLHVEESPVPAQSNWRWCQKCEGLFFNANPGQGTCPADGASHDGGTSGDYFLHLSPPATIGQDGWRWCRKCEGMYFGGNPSTGVCPAGGRHDGRRSGDYRLRRAGEYSFDRPTFFGQYRARFTEALDGAQTAGLTRLLDFMERDAEVTDLRWFAYMLATVKLECANRYQPLREFGCTDGRTPVCTPIPGNQRSYGDPVVCPNLRLTPPRPCPAGQAAHTYYGRGYVQITFQGNYLALGNATGRGAEFVHAPDNVMRPEAAYPIMSVGMVQGLFTRRKLADFINETTLDYRGARRIINPGDTGTFAVIAGHAERFQASLEAAMR